jgi:hypothetical protein
MGETVRQKLGIQGEEACTRAGGAFPVKKRRKASASCSRPVNFPQKTDCPQHDQRPVLQQDGKSSLGKVGE